MSKYSEEETYHAYLTRHENNKTQSQDNNNNNNNNNDKNDILDTSKLDNLMAKIEYLTAKIEDIHSRLGLGVE
jgi:hypothetical protein